LKEPRERLEKASVGLIVSNDFDDVVKGRSETLTGFLDRILAKGKMVVLDEIPLGAT